MEYETEHIESNEGIAYVVFSIYSKFIANNLKYYKVYNK